MRKIFSIIFCSCFSLCLLSQTNSFTISGKVTDISTGEALIGVNIISNNIGSSTDIDGNYSLNLPQGQHEITYKYIGYQEIKKQFFITSDTLITLNIKLNQSSEQLNTVVVSAGKFNQRLEETTVSMEVIKPSLIENKNSSNICLTICNVKARNLFHGCFNI